MSGRLAASAVSVILLAVCAGLAWHIRETVIAGPVPPPAVAATVRTSAMTAGPAAADDRLPPLEDFAAVAERPLFHATRRPVAEEVPVVAAAAPVNLFLYGVVIEDARRIAHLQAPPEGRVRALRVGDSIDGWKVAEIHTNRVVLREGARRQTVHLRKPADAEGAAAGASDPVATVPADKARRNRPIDNERENERRPRRD
jgi:hypothetical protein